MNHIDYDDVFSFFFLKSKKRLSWYCILYGCPLSEPPVSSTESSVSSYLRWSFSKSWIFLKRDRFHFKIISFCKSSRRSGTYISFFTRFISLKENEEVDEGCPWLTVPSTRTQIGVIIFRHQSGNVQDSVLQKLIVVRCNYFQTSYTMGKYRTGCFEN